MNKNALDALMTLNKARQRTPNASALINIVLYDAAQKHVSIEPQHKPTKIGSLARTARQINILMVGVNLVTIAVAFLEKLFFQFNEL
jgi:hypothetical protein